MSDAKRIGGGDCLNIEKMPNGGFVVFEGRSSINPADPYPSCGPLFACTTIGEALEFIHSRLGPEKPPHGPNGIRCSCPACRPVRKPSAAGDWEVR